MMASLLRRSASLAPARRAFSTSTPRLASLQWDRNNRENLADTLPEYPYGAPQLYKQSRSGLYGGQRIRFGNNVSEKGKNKSRRSWRPNILNRRLFSKALNRHVQVRVSARVLRTIDKLGGLDEYLLGEKEARIRELGESGWWLRWAIMQTNTVKNRFAAERIALGLPADVEEMRIEEEDAEAVLAASTPDAEIAELTLEEDADIDLEAEPLVSDTLAEDDVFQIEQSKDLPPLKFRVGRNKYIMLTENGWRSLTPSPKKQELLAKEKIREKLKSFQEITFNGRMSGINTEMHRAARSAIAEEVQKRLEARLKASTNADGSSKPSTNKTTRLHPQEYERIRADVEESLKSVRADAEGMLKGTMKKELERLVQAEYERPALEKEQRRIARAEKRKLEQKLEEVDSVAV